MFYKDGGEYDIKGSWNITDLLNSNENQGDKSNQAAAQNINKFIRKNSQEKADVIRDSLDNEIANRILADLHYEGAFKSKKISANNNPVLKPKLPPTNL